MRLPFLREAVEELDWEVFHLEVERRGTGERFFEEVEKRVELAADYPHLGKAVTDVPRAEEMGAREFVIARFGCSVIVGRYEGELTVIAIAPARREPGYWNDRLDE
jgi:hypothetical protein